jgi:LmbE family N-acetylglucosaminyl deacetylase
MLNFQLPKPAASVFKVMCLGSHCDDIEIGCGGTILTLSEENSNVHMYWVVFSSDHQRLKEARHSADTFLERVKLKKILIKDFRDGFLPYAGSAIKEYFEELKEEFTPDLIFTHYRHDLHQDHRFISELTWNTFRNHLILEYEVPKYDGDLGSPNVFVQLSEPIYQTKIRYILASFGSQNEKQWFREDTFRAIMRIRGMESNAESKYAEAFYCRKMILRSPVT